MTVNDRKVSNDRLGDALLLEAEQQLQARRISNALALFDRAEESGCDADSCAGGRWLSHMLAGDFEHAWQQSDAIAARGNPDPQRFWNGATLEGSRVLIRCLHGLGDTIHFIRYARLVRGQARFVAIEAQPALKDLLAASGLADNVFTWGEPEPAWDVQIEVVELPRIFRTTLDSIPDRVPYLCVPRGHIWREKSGERPLRIGLVWQSGSYNPARSIPARDVAALLAFPNTEFFSLQAGPERFDLDPVASRIQHLYEEGESVLMTASKLQALDLVVTVDTMMAHLTGALNMPVWTLLPYECDWRWMLDRPDSPWYPSMRLFRQHEPGDWTNVIGRVREQLAAFSAANPTNRRPD